MVTSAYNIVPIDIYVYSPFIEHGVPRLRVELDNVKALVSYRWGARGYAHCV